ncbi:MAG: HD domain-containing phosphohydrolase, partial [Pirellulaceae bacterium]
CLACGLWASDKFLFASVGSDLSAGFSAPNESTSAGVNMHLVVVRGLTLIWIGGLQAAIGYVVLSRLRNETVLDHTQSRMRILHREKDVVRTRNAIIFGLAKLADYRDRETGQHLERIALYSTCLATALRSDPRYRGVVTAAFVKMIGVSSVLHDIGKVAIEDTILRKAGALDAQERERVQQHTDVGAECIRQIEHRLGSCNFLAMARDIAQCHHERWDGQGYPRGIAKEQIPLAARIVSVADVYDALASKRVYKEAFSHEKCVSIIEASSGTQFDPGIIDVFLQVAPQFQQIARRFGERAEPSTAPPTRKPPTRGAADQLITSLLEQDEPTESLAAIS